MIKISAAELYELFLDTVGRCTPALREQTDELIVYNLSEEFDVGAWSFLHEYSLSRLYAAGLIDEETVELSKEVRRRWLSLKDQKDWSIAEIKSNQDWDELFRLCEFIKNRCENRGGLALSTEAPPPDEE